MKGFCDKFSFPSASNMRQLSRLFRKKNFSSKNCRGYAWATFGLHSITASGHTGCNLTRFKLLHDDGGGAACDDDDGDDLTRVPMTLCLCNYPDPFVSFLCDENRRRK